MYFLTRFMRGERDMVAAAVPGNYRGTATPNTPSTASTNVRTNPLAYQRMHSNDSDKDSAPPGSNGGGPASGGSGRQSD